jgi:hypothetical protein
MIKSFTKIPFEIETTHGHNHKPKGVISEEKQADYIRDIMYKVEVSNNLFFFPKKIKCHLKRV